MSVSARPRHAGPQPVQNPRAELLDGVRDAGVDQHNIRTEKTTGTGRLPVLVDLVDEFDAGDVLVVAALDRLGRVGRRLLEFVDELKDRGVGLRTLRNGIDTSHPIAGPLQLYVFRPPRWPTHSHHQGEARRRPRAHRRWRHHRRRGPGHRGQSTHALQAPR